MYTAILNKTTNVPAHISDAKTILTVKNNDNLNLWTYVLNFQLIRTVFGKIVYVTDPESVYTGIAGFEHLP